MDDIMQSTEERPRNGAEPFILLHSRDLGEQGKPIKYCHKDNLPRFDFDDFQFYNEQKDRDGCIKVDMASITVRNNSFFHGVQSRYRLTFKDGSTETVDGPRNFYSSGYYSYTGRHARERTYELHEDEYITGLYIRQGEIIDCVTFLTNQGRKLKSGGDEGNLLPKNSMTFNDSHRLVAFAGTVNGVVSGFGCYVERISWSIRKPYILMRALLLDGRASPRNLKPHGLFEWKQKLICRIVCDSFPDDVFRHVIGYL
mmetsp:Transcript_49024/g.59342  ORF Transcript_49024/g.59342 Transcript_49024/m.59342 type:complete len:256 (-) Transcript_49024:339-1106(-)